MKITKSVIKYKAFDEKVYRMSLCWLSDPEIKKLTMTPDTTREEREKWFESLSVMSREMLNILDTLERRDILDWV